MEDRKYKLSAGGELAELINREAVNVRRVYWKHSQINFAVISADKNEIVLKVDVGNSQSLKKEPHIGEEARIIEGIRNSLLGMLGDLVPCPRYRVFYSSQRTDVQNREYAGPFYNPKRQPQASNVAYDEGVVIRWRDKNREKFKQLWERL